MSRALDPKDAAATKVGDLRSVYKDIVAVLCGPGINKLEIELLGKSHPLPPGSNLLQDGDSIAIPKTKLVQAFVVAREIFWELSKNIQDDHQLELKHASAVMLLMDPEHLTAANVRKKLLQNSQMRSPFEIKLALERELVFIDSLLTSPLHRHTKSPTLWYHRRWLLGQFRSHQIPRSSQQDLASVILVSAQRHARNYYAWNHMRWMLQWEDTTPHDANAYLLSPVQNWCLRHPGDTSGWSFLLFCLLNLDVQGSKYNGLGIESNSAVCKEVLRLAISFNWNHESVWVFLGTLVASGRVDEGQRVEFLEAIKTKIQAQPDGSHTQKKLQRILDWYNDNQKQLVC